MHNTIMPVLLIIPFEGRKPGRISKKGAVFFLLSASPYHYPQLDVPMFKQGSRMAFTLQFLFTPRDPTMYKKMSCLIIAVALTSPVSAAIITFNSQTAWEAANPGFSFDGFSGPDVQLQEGVDEDIGLFSVRY